MQVERFRRSRVRSRWPTRSEGDVSGRRRRTAAAGWAARLDDLTRRMFPTLDAVLAEGALVTGRVQALSTEAAGLGADAPSAAAAADRRSRLTGAVRFDIT